MLAVICLDVMQQAIWVKCTVRFEVLTLVLLMVQGFWDVVLCHWVNRSQRFEGS